MVNAALADVQQATSDLDFKRMITDDADYVIRQHQLEGIGKFTLVMSYLLFHRCATWSYYSKRWLGIPSGHLCVGLHHLFYS